MIDPTEIQKLLKLQSAAEVSRLVYASATYYPHYIKLYIPKVPYKKIAEGFEVADHEELSTSFGVKDDQESNKERSMRRSKKNVKDYVITNEFDIFATFTFKKDRQDITKSRTKMANWIKNQQKRTGKFDYLIVPELHKDGQSLHFHAVLKNYRGELLASINPKKGNPLKRNGRQVYTIKSYTLGFSDARKIDDDADAQSKVAHYISKYVTKDMPLFAGKKRYWASRSLILPLVIDNPHIKLLTMKPIYEKELEYGTIRYIVKTTSEGGRA